MARLPATALPATAARVRCVLPPLCILLLAACATAVAPAPSPQAAARAPAPAAAATPRAVVLLSFDGLPAAATTDGSMPTLSALARDGVRADGMLPSFPSMTFPNHYTLATGLRPDHHGIVHNYMRDAAFGHYQSKVNGAEGRWYGGEPIWATLQRQGGRAGTVAWIGAQDPHGARMPALWTAFDTAQPDAARIGQVLAWLDLPRAARLALVMAYFDLHDKQAHAFGPDAPEAMAARRTLDDALRGLLAGLSARGLRQATDVIVVSDHGMAAVPPGNVDTLPASLPRDAFSVDGTGIVLGVHPRPGREAEVARGLLGRQAHHACLRKDALPPRWHYGTHPRVAPIVCVADPGWYLYVDPPARSYARVRGEHGYDPQDRSMRAVFVAAGPSFRAGVRLRPFDNVDVYPLLARLLGVVPAANDGTLAPLLPALRKPAQATAP